MRAVGQQEACMVTPPAKHEARRRESPAGEKKVEQLVDDLGMNLPDTRIA
jgi:hypothetical protein